MSATAEGTNSYFQSFRKKGIPPTAYRALGRTGLTTSILGFGCYRIDDEVSIHINSIDKALTNGCNLIDTSTNYTDGGSERCIGKVMKAGISRGAYKRENIIVVSKVGYVQGENLEIAQEQESSGDPYPEMVKYADGCWHCLHPKFIKAQLQRSLERTGLEKIDVYLLHNPEYYFLDAIHSSTKKSLPELRQIFYRRIREAFLFLEECVKEGFISHYGVSSNSFGRPEKAPDMTSLPEMWKIAEEIGVTQYGENTKHHFSVIQLPLNLFESDPALLKNANGKSTLEFAIEKNMGVLVNRPLNAFVSNRMIRLADFPTQPTRFPIAELLKMASLLEEEFIRIYAPQIHVDPESMQPEAYFRWSEELKGVNLKTLGVDQWMQFSTDVLLPQLHYLINELDKVFGASENKNWKEWRNNYIGAIEELIKAVYNECSQASQETSNEISNKINPLLDERWKNEPLSRKAIGIAAYTNGVTCILNGMRQPKYVEDSLGILTLPPIENSIEILTSLSQSV